MAKTKDRFTENKAQMNTGECQKNHVFMENTNPVITVRDVQQRREIPSEQQILRADTWTAHVQDTWTAHVQDLWTTKH